RHVIAYCMTAEQTLANRRAVPEPNPEGNHTRLVSFDVATGASEVVKSGDGALFNPSYVGATVAWVRKYAQGTAAGIYYADGRSGQNGDGRSAARPPAGSRAVFHSRQTAPPPPRRPTLSPNPRRPHSPS